MKLMKMKLKIQIMFCIVIVLAILVNVVSVSAAEISATCTLNQNTNVLRCVDDNRKTYSTTLDSAFINSEGVDKFNTRFQATIDNSGNLVLSNVFAKNVELAPHTTRTPSPAGRTPAGGSTPPPAETTPTETPTQTPPPPEPAAPPSQTDVPEIVNVAVGDGRVDFVRIGSNRFIYVGPTILMGVTPGSEVIIGESMTDIGTPPEEGEPTMSPHDLQVYNQLEQYVNNNPNPNPRSDLMGQGVAAGMDINSIINTPSAEITANLIPRGTLLQNAQRYGVSATGEGDVPLTNSQLLTAINTKRTEIVRTYDLTGTDAEIDQRVDYIHKAQDVGIPVPTGDAATPGAWQEFDTAFDIAEEARAAGIQLGADQEWTPEAQTALRADIDAKNALITELQSTTNGDRPPSEEFLRGMSADQLNAMRDRRAAYHDIQGNPNEWYSVNTGDDIGSMHVIVDPDGTIFARHELGDGDELGDGEHEDVRLGTVTYCADCPHCDIPAGCNADNLYHEGNVINTVDADGNVVEHFQSDGVTYVMTDADGNTHDVTATDCAAPPAGSSCEPRPEGFSGVNLYWVPSSWTELLTSGGPATQMIRAISNMATGGDFWNAVGHGYISKWLDTYFNLERMMTVDLCQAGAAGHGALPAGVGLSPFSNLIPTVTIQAQKFKVEPCKGLTGKAVDACKLNQSLVGKDYYWVYRITGKAVPRDCEMRFNIFLKKSGENKQIYATDRIAPRGAQAFDMTGANAIVTTDKTLSDFTSVCITFTSSMVACLTNAGETVTEICNTIYDSGSSVGSVTQIAGEGQANTGGGGSSGGPQTSSTRDGLAV